MWAGSRFHFSLFRKACNHRDVWTFLTALGELCAWAA